MSRKSGRSPTRKSPRRSSAVTLDTVRELALALPGVEEGLSYGTPAFRVGKKLLARLHEDGETLVLKVDLLVRDSLLVADPDTFFITDHYQDYPYMLVRLATVRREPLSGLLETAWRSLAPKRLLATRKEGA
ncbi:MmcQ/YjbR family DNA-binding protein [Archangium minus]|uniref:MmcQ/YjbR family DNA-binding protein n=1 Tax=Archangium minus TaxID=83450 RepID=A0ABY9XB76_9BACT|nr:MmcQ/YjbR family DNA-binding protein [Archangium minus]